MLLIGNIWRSRNISFKYNSIVCLFADHVMECNLVVEHLKEFLKGEESKLYDNSVGKQYDAHFHIFTSKYISNF